MKIRFAALLAMVAFAATVNAAEPAKGGQALPPGHPPMGGMPAGHPAVEKKEEKKPAKAKKAKKAKKAEKKEEAPAATPATPATPAAPAKK